MTRIIFLVTGIVLTALAVAVPTAFGEGRLAGSPEPVDAVKYFYANERATLGSPATTVSRPDSHEVVRPTGVGYLDANERGANATPQWQKALEIRSEALNRQLGLGKGAQKANAQAIKALEIRSEALNRQFGLGVYGMSDSHERGRPVSTEPVSTPTVGSDREIEWPQIGIGFGVGMLLAVGLLFALRSTRIRPLAH